MNINLELLKKYDVPGPRYTSYPPAPHFHEGFTQSDYVDEIVKTNYGENLPDLSLYFHIPYCDTLCYFCGCNMIVTRNRERIREYIKYIKNEIDLLRQYLNPDRKVAQLHWGGGTPTSLTPEEIDSLMKYIHQSFQFKKDAEIGCEIDPRGLTKDHLVSLRENGFNRISMGVQDFNEKVQKYVNRIQPDEMTTKVVNWVKELGFKSINLDLMYGLPFQTIQTFEETLAKTIKLSPDRLAVFNYAHVPWMKKHQALIHPEDLPSAQDKLNILKLTIEKLTSNGYVFIGMDHFAKPNDDLAIALKNKKLYRNFQGYSTHAGCDLYAFGITSISQLKNIYAQNFKTEKDYFKAIDNETLPILKGYRLTDDDQIRRSVIMKLMCDFELNFLEIENEYKINFKEYFKNSINALSAMENEGLVEVKDEKIKVSEMGRLLIRNIAMKFDGFIERNQDELKYSRTI